MTSIGESAFIWCYDLNGSLTIPEGITSIGTKAFNNCTQITTIISKATSAPTAESNAFYNMATLTTVYVSSTAIENYQDATDGWSDIDDDKFVAGDYAIIVANSENGSVIVSPNTSTVWFGDTVTINTTPANDYQVDEVTTSVDTVTVTHNQHTNTATFVMPIEAVEVIVTFKKNVHTSIADVENIIPFTRVQNTLHFAQPTQIALYNTAGTMLYNGSAIEYTLPSTAEVYILKTTIGTFKMISEQ